MVSESFEPTRKKGKQKNNRSRATKKKQKQKQKQKTKVVHMQPETQSGDSEAVPIQARD